MSIRLEALPLDGAFLVHTTAHHDARGSFTEIWREDELAFAGLPVRFVQDNWARSKKHVLRGLHFQRRHPQGKLVTVVRGAIQDAIVDLRPDSATYRRAITVDLSESKSSGLWVPAGFAHGYAVLSDDADVIYKCTAVYDREDEGGVRWNDPLLAIKWKVGEPVLSGRDAAWAFLEDGKMSGREDATGDSNEEASS